MSNIAIELVPNNLAEFEVKIKLITEIYSDINIVNIPDILKLNVRSWEAAIQVSKYCDRVIPHIRAMDFNLYSGFSIANKLLDNNINELLIISGDQVKEDKNKNKTSSIDLIKYLKHHHPEFKVYAAIDPYRSSFQQEINYIQEKKSVGVDGFFTQPFFNIDMLKLYLNILKDEQVFFGISPVTSERSKQYWEIVNKVVFPRDFSTCLNSNAKFAKQALEIIKEHKKDIYFMPIKEDECKYLGKILS